MTLQMPSRFEVSKVLASRLQGRTLSCEKLVASRLSLPWGVLFRGLSPKQIVFKVGDKCCLQSWACLSLGFTAQIQWRDSPVFADLEGKLSACSCWPDLRSGLLLWVLGCCCCPQVRTRVALGKPAPGAPWGTCLLFFAAGILNVLEVSRFSCCAQLNHVHPSLLPFPWCAGLNPSLFSHL